MLIKFAFDGMTARTYDAEGRLHISRSHISKACVNPYRGDEIPTWKELGLDPNRVYHLLRDPEELRKGAESFARNQILIKHIAVNADDPQKESIVGAIGSNVEFLDPFLDADLCIWDADAIARIETEQQCEFSCSYRYVPVMTTGEYNGEKYDGIMTQIQGNHLALVESGRAGSEVRAADHALETTPMKRTKLGNSLIVALTTAFPKVTIANDSELEKVLAGARHATFGKPQRESARKLILAMDSELKPERVDLVMDALTDVDDPEPKKKDNDEPEPAKDCSCGAKDGKHSKDCAMGKDSKRAKDKAKDDMDEDDPAVDGVSKEEMGKAMDSLSVSLRKEFAAADEAKRAVRTVVGDIIAMDTADKIYEFALDEMKVDHEGVTGVAALKALFNLAKERKASAAPVAVAMDSAGAVAKFPHAGRFVQA